MAEELPGPYAWPILGNLLDVRSDEGFVKALENLCDIYGPIYQITIRGSKFVIVCSADEVLRLVDEKQFIKVPPAALDDAKGPRGLFSARGDDPDWGQAHRILAPAFGPLSVEDMIPGMKDIASQLILKWARAGEGEAFLITDDFTRLTLDTIALCTMDYRFNSFYQTGMHPFVAAMTDVLMTNGKRNQMPWMLKKIDEYRDGSRYTDNRDLMKATAQKIIEYRRENPTDHHDFLNTMMYGKDPKTGERMRDELIGTEMLTFLVAGHETTSGLLSFTLMELLRHPKAYLKLQEEVDRVLKDENIESKHLRELPYLEAVMRETLRLHPTVPALTKRVNPTDSDKPVMFGDGKYLVDPNTRFIALLPKSMSDPSYWGDDAGEFNPDRMLASNPNFDRYMKAWRPFGSGTRACIGQHFAWQEAMMVTALILQNFNVSLQDPNYQVHMAVTLTAKPKDLYVRFKLRNNLTATALANRLSGQHMDTVTNGDKAVNGSSKDNTGEVRGKLTVLFGSNGGTCYSLAQRLSSAAATKYGIKTRMEALDTAVDDLPKDQPVVIITPSYEGQPPDNASRFVHWLETTDASMKNIKYAVFGCGDKNWRDTFFRIPKLVGQCLKDRGAEELLELGTSDVTEHKVIDDFTKWQDELLSKVLELNGVSGKMSKPNMADQVEISNDKRASQLSNGMMVAKVLETKQLTDPGQPEKRHLEIELPEESTYECGDYLAVLPINSDDLVKKIMRHWKLPLDATILLKSNAFAPLPQGSTLSIYDVLRGYLELGQQLSKTDLKELKEHTNDAATTAEIESLITNDKLYDSEILSNKTSLFDFLSNHQKIDMPFATFLSSLMPLAVRQYSISSSPLAKRKSCTITYSVVKIQTKDPDQVHEGVATTYLSKLAPGDSIQVSLKRTATINSKAPFRLPANNETPIMMFCAGTGLAPFRGFVQQRAVMLEANKNLRLAPAVLFAGCRSSTGDRLYADEFDRWAEAGAVDIRYAFSQEPEKANGCKHISDRTLYDQKDVVDMWRQGARVYVCGNRAALESVGHATKQIIAGIHVGKTEEEMRQIKSKFDEAASERVVSDIFD